MDNGFVKHEIILKSSLSNGKVIEHKYNCYDLFNSWVDTREVIKETLKDNEDRLMDNPN